MLGGWFEAADVKASSEKSELVGVAMGATERLGRVQTGMGSKDVRSARVPINKVRHIEDPSVDRDPPPVFRVVVLKQVLQVDVWPTYVSPPQVLVDTARCAECVITTATGRGSLGLGGGQGGVDVIPTTLSGAARESTDRHGTTDGESHREVAVNLASVAAEEPVWSGVGTLGT